MKRLFFAYRTKILTLVIISSFLLLASTCNKNEDVIQNVPVDLYLNINSTPYNNLNVVGGWVMIDGGLKGIIVYRKSMEEIKTYDRNCPYKPTSDCAIIFPENSGLIAADSCCGSRFLLSDGSVIKGPATLPLKEYNNTFDGAMIHIFN